MNILLVEDDLDLAATVIQYLELEDIQCDHASNGMAGLQFMQDNLYDVLLLDLNLPRLDGLAVCEELRKRGNDIPVLMLTARDQLRDKVKGFDAGTDDYLVKPFEMQELVLRLLALSKRRSGQARILRCGKLVLDLDTKTACREGQLLRLSPTGLRLLEVLMRHSPGVVSRQQLEQAVWGDEPPNSNSLKVHIFKLRKAIDSGFATTQLYTISGQGFALYPEDIQPLGKQS